MIQYDKYDSNNFSDFVSDMRVTDHKHYDQ